MKDRGDPIPSCPNTSFQRTLTRGGFGPLNFGPLGGKRNRMMTQENTFETSMYFERWRYTLEDDSVKVKRLLTSLTRSHTKSFTRKSRTTQRKWSIRQKPV